MIRLLIRHSPNRTIYSIRKGAKGTYWLPSIDQVCESFIKGGISFTDLKHITVVYDICLEFETVEELLEKQDEVKMHILMES